MVIETGISRTEPSILLSIRELETRFEQHVIHQGLALEVRRGEILALFGGSGTGKSTLLRAVIGLERPQKGSIVYDGQELLNLDQLGWRKLRRQVGYAFQGGALFDSLTVGENLAYPLREFTELSAKECMAAVDAMLEKVGLPGIADKLPAALSGGMQKRVGLARTLMLDPDLVLYDEPTAGLDPANTRKISELMRGQSAQGKTGILVTHDVACALSVADRIAYLEGGKIVAIQGRDEVLASAHPRIAAYMQGEIL